MDKVFYRSHRLPTLRWISVLVWLPVPLAIWLIGRTPGIAAETPLGPVLPALLVGLTLVLPASLGLLHDRYVLAVTRAQDGAVTVTTFLLWGQRRRVILPGGEAVERAGDFDSLWAPDVDAPYLSVRLDNGTRLVVDRQGDAPQGWDAVHGVLGAARQVKAP